MMKHKVLIVHNIITPHLIPVFNYLSKAVNLEVLYCAQRESNRSWEIAEQKYNFKILRAKKIELRGKDLFTLFYNPNLIEELKKSHPDLIIICGWDLPSYWLTAFYCKRNKIPYILWSGSTDNEKSWRRILGFPIAKYMIFGAQKFLAYGLRAREYLLKLGADPENISVVLNSTNIDHYINLNKNNTNLSKKIITEHKLKNKKVILFYGQLINRKNPQILIDILPNLIKKDKKIKLVIIGSGYLEKNLKKQIKNKKLSNYAVIVSDPGDKNMPAWFTVSDIFVLPSNEEVWGLVVNQAMAAKLPVVVADSVGCTPDLIISGHTGLIFRKDNKNDLQKQLKILLKDEKLRVKLSTNARKQVKKTHPKLVAARIFDVINKMLADSKHLNNFEKSNIPTVYDDCKLSFLEYPKLPFKIARVYYISQPLANQPRGFHAHKKNKQFFICLRGSVELFLDDGKNKKTIKLDGENENKGVLIDSLIWHEMHKIKKGTIMLVLASHKYDPDDYIRNYQDFLEFIE